MVTMDTAIDRARRPLRNRLNKLLEELGKKVEEKPTDLATVNAEWKMVEEEYGKLRELDERASNYLIDRDADERLEEQEFEQTKVFRVKVESMRVKIDALFAEPADVHLQNQSAASVIGDMEGLKLRLPKFELPSFDGDLLNWLAFWAQFQKIDQAGNLEGSDKFNCLLASLKKGSKPYELVKEYPASDENYEKAVEKLKNQYGNSDVLLQVYIRELLSLVISNVSSKEKLPVGTLFNKVDSHLRALKSLDLDKADPATWLYPLVESCLPREILSTWMHSPSYKEKGTADKTRLDFLLEFLGQEVEHLQKIELAEKGFRGLSGTEHSSSIQVKRKFSDGVFTNKPNFGKKGRFSDPVPTLKGFSNLEQSKGKHMWEQPKGTLQNQVGLRGNAGKKDCILCGRPGHGGIECRQATRMTLEERKQKVLEGLGCFICLERHFVRDCRSKVKCQLCGERHCNVMCRQLGIQTNNRTSTTPAIEGNQSTTNISSSNKVTSCPVQLQTLVAYIKNGNIRHKVRLFFDVGSQRSYILKATAELLMLEGKGTEVVVHELFGGRTTERINHKLYDVEICSANGENQEDIYHCKVSLRDQERISNSIPRISPDFGNESDELRQAGIVLSDVGGDCPAIDILIGADLFGKLITGEKVDLAEGRVAINTKLGWTLIGEDNRNFKEWYETAESVTSMSVKDFSITQLWDMDTIGIQDPTEVKAKSQEEEEAQEQFLRDITRNEEGRYVVKLPWKEGHPPLPENWKEAEKRLIRTTEKLKESGLLATYGKLFKDWEHNGYIEEVERSAAGNKVHYVPHRAVVKKDSLTTPVRPVFDASCKIGRVPSLNDCLYKGLNYILQIPAVLLGFRRYKVGFSSDIKKAFQMIEVAEEDRDAMRFLWWNEKGEIKVYRHRRVMFGATCSPFILGATLNHHLSNLKENKEIGYQLLKSMYVDNCLHSTATKEKYLDFRRISTQLLAECKMDLRMWLSNVDEFDDPATHTIGVLGMLWDRMEDTLFVKIEGISMPQKITKRTVLSAVQKVFDPVGVTSPALIPIKNLIQGAFQRKLKWDKEFEEDQAITFKKWVEEIGFLHQIRLSRWISDIEEGRGEWTFHIFTDASSTAYGAVIYLRVQDDNHVTIRFITAKARISPVKRVTIPRLELMGCLVGARLYKSVRNGEGFENIKASFWTDSTTALAWIRRDDKWGTFVGNRISEIVKLTSKESWRHVPGIFNPADLPSRGCSPRQLFCSRWWEGPSWLFQHEELPVWKEEIEEEKVSSELRRTAINIVSMSASDLQERRRLDILAGGKQRSFRSWVRVVAIMKRFIFNCSVKGKSLRKSGFLTFAEMEAAELTIIKAIQHDSFGSKDQKELSLD